MVDRDKAICHDMRNERMPRFAGDIGDETFGESRKDLLSF